MALAALAPTTGAGERQHDVVALAAGDVAVEVEGRAGPSGWASYYHTLTVTYLRALEAYLEVPFHDAAAAYYRANDGRPRIRIVGQAEVALEGQRVGGLNNSAGLFPVERGILVEPGLAGIGTPALVLHELAHFYFYDLPQAETAWLTEGIASFLAVAMVASGDLRLPTAEAASLAAHWGAGSQAPTAAEDLPLEADFRFTHQERFRLWYDKTFKVQLILYEQLGSDRYLELLRAFLADRRQHATTSGVLATLRTLLDTDWRRMLSGWVFPGAYDWYGWGDVPKPPF